MVTKTFNYYKLYYMLLRLVGNYVVLTVGINFKTEKKSKNDSRIKVLAGYISVNFVKIFS